MEGQNRRIFNEKIKLLIVDDDETFLEELSNLMSDRYIVDTAKTGIEAIKKFESSDFDIMLLDIDLGFGVDGFDVLDKIHNIQPDFPIIMVTRDSSARTAVSALKRGAADYIDKNPDLEELEERITRAIKEHRIIRENKAFRFNIDQSKEELIGKSKKMGELRAEIELVSKNANPVLIVGETGTGKELVAKEIRKLFAPECNFIAINCAAIPRDLFEARLFGSEKGAYTGADRAIQGVFELASDGVLFLDEITEIESALQAKLLRVIEEREFERIGSNRKIRFNGKLVASTNRDLREAIRSGALRNDLFYRFSAYVIKVPPLRERKDDIPLLVDYFLRKKSLELKKEAKKLPEGAMETLCAYDWPGNVRELENVIESFLVRGKISLDTIFLDEGCKSTSTEELAKLCYKEAKKIAVRDFQKRYIEAVRAACGGDLGKTAKRMGISRYGLHKILKELSEE